MMVVGDRLIELASRVIDNINPELIGDVSVDIILGNIFEPEIAPPSFNRVVNSFSGEKYYSRREHVKDGDFFILPENSFVQCISKEYFIMPNNITGYFYLNSSLARAGFDHSAAILINPGWSGNLVLELKNSLKFQENILIPGKPIGKVVFHEHEFVRGYQGRFNNQTTI